MTLRLKTEQELVEAGVAGFNISHIDTLWLWFHDPDAITHRQLERAIMGSVRWSSLGPANRQIFEMAHEWARAKAGGRDQDITGAMRLGKLQLTTVIRGVLCTEESLIKDSAWDCEEDE